MEIRYLNNGTTKQTAASTDILPVQDENGKTWPIYIQKIIDLFKTSVVPPLQTFILQIDDDPSRTHLGVPIFQEDLGGGLIVKPKLPLMADIDLSAGNYSAIAISMHVKSLTLPKTHKNGLVYLDINRGTSDIDNIDEIYLSDYPNLASATISPGERMNKLFSRRIMDDSIDLPKIGTLHLAGSKRAPFVVTKPNLEVFAYGNMQISLSSVTLQDLTFNFSNFEPVGFGEDGFFTMMDVLVHNFNAWVSFNPFLEVINFENLSEIVIQGDSNMIFNLESNNLSQQCVDDILALFNEKFSGGGGELLLRSQNEYTFYSDRETLVVGNTYIVSISETDDFTNVGYVEDGVPFVATGTTPNEWYASAVNALDAGFANGFEIVAVGETLPDGVYNQDQFCVTSLDGEVTVDFRGNAVPCEIGQLFKMQHFQLFSETDPDRVIWGNGDAYFVQIKITSIARNAVPTGGSENPDLVALLGKGWNVATNL